MMKWLQEVMGGKDKKPQDSLQQDYIVINLTMYYNNLQKLWGTN